MVEKPANQTLDYESLQRAYSTELLPKLRAAHAALAQHDAADPEGAKVRGRMGFKLPDLSGIKGELCHDWPMVKTFMDYAGTLGAFLPGIGTILAALKGVFSFVDLGVIPVVCPAGVGGPRTATGGPETAQKAG